MHNALAPFHIVKIEFQHALLGMMISMITVTGSRDTCASNCGLWSKQTGERVGC
jgi:hypothetical protein